MIPRLYTYIPFCPSYMVLALTRLDCSPAYIYTSLTFLNSSVEARAFGSSDLTLSTAAGGGGGPCLVLRDLRMSKNCWTCSVVIICGDSWFIGNV
jgi:hypothetical protein